MSEIFLSPSSSLRAEMSATNAKPNITCILKKKLSYTSLRFFESILHSSNQFHCVMNNINYLFKDIKALNCSMNNAINTSILIDREAISKTRTSCLNGDSKHLEAIKAFIVCPCLESPFKHSYSFLKYYL